MAGRRWRAEVAAVEDQAGVAGSRESFGEGVQAHIELHQAMEPHDDRVPRTIGVSHARHTTPSEVNSTSEQVAVFSAMGRMLPPDTGVAGRCNG